MATLVSFGQVDRLVTELKRNWVRNVQDKSKRWWMEIVLPNDVCIEPTEEMKKVGSNDVYPHVLIRITWDNVIKYGRYAIHKVRQYGTYPEDLLRRDLHTLRKAVAAALQTLCKSDCIWEMVGSDSNVSDVDINVFDDRVEQLKPLIEKHVATWLGGNRIDVLFDMNIYLSAFGRKEVAGAKGRKGRTRKVPLYIQRIPFTKTINYVFIHPKHTPQYQESQLIWALVHLIDETKGSLNEDVLEEYMQKTAWRESWQKAKELHRGLEGQKENADKIIVALVKDAQKQWQVIAELDADADADDTTVEHYMNTLSTIQYYSRETYLTRGAYFHVVMEMSSGVKHLNLQPFEYMHSVIDNLAFIAELCKKDTLCPLQYSTIFAKISKYIYRVCDALLKVGVSKPNVRPIFQRAAELNALRKKANPADVQTMVDQIQKLHDLLGVEFRGDEEFTNMDLVAIFESCMHMALDPFTNLSRGSISRTKKKTASRNVASASCTKSITSCKNESIKQSIKQSKTNLTKSRF